MQEKLKKKAGDHKQNFVLSSTIQCMSDKKVWLKLITLVTKTLIMCTMPIPSSFKK